MNFLNMSSAISLAMFLTACNGSSNSNPPANDTMMNNAQEAMPDVSLEATVRIWTDSQLLVDYTVSNIGPLELIIFDVGPTTTTGLDENGLVTLFQAKRETGETTLFESPPTIGGRNLSPEQTLTGAAARNIPIAIDHPASLETFAPDTVQLCIGYGNADDIIPTTRPDGMYPFNEDLDLQLLTCTILSRS